MRKLRIYSIILSLILSGLSNGNNIPRSPALVPISAHYMSLLSIVILTFTANLGEIEVEITNTTSGGYVSGTIDTKYLS